MLNSKLAEEDSPKLLRVRKKQTDILNSAEELHVRTKSYRETVLGLHQSKSAELQ